MTDLHACGLRPEEIIQQMNALFPPAAKHIHEDGELPHTRFAALVVRRCVSALSQLLTYAVARRYNYLDDDVRNFLTRLSSRAQDLPAFLQLLREEKSKDADFW
jgi:hypothetical protein